MVVPASGFAVVFGNRWLYRNTIIYQITSVFHRQHYYSVAYLVSNGIHANPFLA
jgi:hypothetical protein